MTEQVADYGLVIYPMLAFIGTIVLIILAKLLWKGWKEAKEQ